MKILDHAYSWAVVSAGVGLLVIAAILFSMFLLVCVKALGMYFGVQVPETDQYIREGVEILVYLSVTSCFLALSARVLHELRIRKD